ncbi:MAG: pirin [Moraxellaceae bacterium]|jgi:redox-sensitive bicupin YhaK (pirin superfamily)|nr:pirin [Moraxellaceae bacterium]
MKQVLGVRRMPRPHWVGDGFPVRSLFSYDSLGRELSPFLLLDYAGPAEFAPATRPRGVGAHQHRGFETVTIVYQGEVAHRDSTGEGGVIGPADVQWMTAGAGILHEEFHSPAFTAAGGVLEMVQLWVNLPARHKLTAPAYQAIASAAVPVVALPAGAGTVRVIAGDYAGHAGAARTFSPLNVWDLRLRAGSLSNLPAPEGWGAAVLVLQGTVQVGATEIVRAGELAVLAAAGEGCVLEANNDAVLLWLCGQPIDEPIVGRGPFVMNTEAEIAQAIADFNSGRFGGLSPHPRVAAVEPSGVREAQATIPEGEAP